MLFICIQSFLPSSWPQRVDQPSSLGAVLLWLGTIVQSYMKEDCHFGKFAQAGERNLLTRMGFCLEPDVCRG